MIRRRALLRNAGLPSEYQEVEWIGFTGTQYIVVGNITDSPKDIKIKEKFYVDRSYSSSDNCILGCRTGNYGNMGFKLPNIWSSKVEVQGIIETNNTLYYSFLYDTPSEFEADINGTSEPYGNFKLTQNGNERTEQYNVLRGYPSVSMYNGLYIGALNKVSSLSWNLHGRIYYIKIYLNNVIVRDFISCYRKSDSVIGMYDTVTRTFFTNAGTGTFTRGENI